VIDMRDDREIADEAKRCGHSSAVARADENAKWTVLGNGGDWWKAERQLSDGVGR
jgi:hypothetical protein